MLEVAAAPGQATSSTKVDTAARAQWIESIPEENKNAMLLRVIRGDDVHLRTELLHEFHGTGESSPGSRTVGEILGARRLRRI